MAGANRVARYPLAGRGYPPRGSGDGRQRRVAHWDGRIQDSERVSAYVDLMGKMVGFELRSGNEPLW